MIVVLSRITVLSHNPQIIFTKLNNASREQAISFVERVRTNFSAQSPGTGNPVPDEITQFEQEVARLVNVERANAGLKSLNHNVSLSNVARTKSQDMVDKNYFSHTSPTYDSPFDMMKSFDINYSYAGENIAMGQATPEAVVKAWMNSEGHKKNILSSNFTDLGVGLAKNNSGTPYWTQMFISSK